MNILLTETQYLDLMKGYTSRCRVHFDSNSGEYKLCETLKTNKYRSLLVPVIQKVLDFKRKKWSEVMNKEDQDMLFDVLNILYEKNPNKIWTWPKIENGYDRGTIKKFIDTILPEVSFVYDLENGAKWIPVNKLDTNYSDSSIFITDIVKDSKSFDANTIYSELENNNTSTLEKVLDNVVKYPEIIYSKYLTDPKKYIQNILFNTSQGDYIENNVISLMEKNGWELIHKGSNGDPIDVFLGVDLIMVKNDEIVCIQCKLVWDIINNNNQIIVKGKPYVSKQQNLDLVAYGGENNKIIVCDKQKENLIDSKHIFPHPKSNNDTMFVVGKNDILYMSDNI
jgi:hypothetical protein